MRPIHRRRLPGGLAAWGLVLVLLFGAAEASAAPAPSLPQLFRQSAPAVVLITQLDAAGKWTSLGSGFVVSPSGIIVTNNHVIAPDPGAVRLSIKLPRGDVYTDVRVVYAEARRDFAVLSIKASGLPVIKVGDSDTVEVGEQIVAIGNPEGLELTFTAGIVESVRLDPSKGYRFIQHQAPISHGSSGGPLLNMKGEVIGINTFSIKDAQNLNGAIPINYVTPYFGDAARMTWEEYARVAAATPHPAPPSAPAAAPSAPTAPPGPAAPPAGAGAGSAPGAFFGKVSFYRPQDASFKIGFAAGVYDAVSLFGAAAQGSGGIDNQKTLALFRCLDGTGDRLIQLRAWVDSTVTQASSDSDAVVSVLARACQTSFSPGTFFERISQYRPQDTSFKSGFSAGVYDAVSLFAAAAQGASGIDEQKALALFRCLDSKGDKLGPLRAWVDSAVTPALPDSDAVVSVLLHACQL